MQARTRPLPAVRDVDSYLAVRVRQSQLDGYYQPKARLLRRLRALKAVEVTLALVAAALAALAAVSPSVGAWAAVVTTAAGAVAAYIAAERYEFLWIEYSRTASDLRRLLVRGTAAAAAELTPENTDRYSWPGGRAATWRPVMTSERSGPRDRDCDQDSPQQAGHGETG